MTSIFLTFVFWLTGWHVGTGEESAVIDGRPLNHYFALWEPSSARTNRMSPWRPLRSGILRGLRRDHLPALLRMAERKESPIHIVAYRVWPYIPTALQNKLPEPIPWSEVQDNLFQSLLRFSSQGQAETIQWLTSEFARIPANSQPLAVRLLVWLHKDFDDGLMPHPKQVAGLLEDLMKSPSPEVRFESIIARLRLLPQPPPNFNQLAQTLGEIERSGAADANGWTELAWCLFDYGDAARPLQPLLARKARVRSIADRALVPLLAWRLSQTRSPLSQLCSELRKRETIEMRRLLIIGLRKLDNERLDEGLLPMLAEWLEGRPPQISPPSPTIVPLRKTTGALEALVEEMPRSICRDHPMPEVVALLLSRVNASRESRGTALLGVLHRAREHPEVSQRGPIRFAAARGLESLGPNIGIDPLRLRSDFQDPWTRLPLARWVAAHGTPVAELLPEFLPWFAASDSRQREVAAEVCRNIAPNDPRVVPAWIEGLSDPGIRRTAIEALANYSAAARDAVAPLGNIVAVEGSGASPEERLAAVRTLATLGATAQSARPQLERAANSPDAALAAAAVQALEKIGRP